MIALKQGGAIPPSCQEQGVFAAGMGRDEGGEIVGLAVDVPVAAGKGEREGGGRKEGREGGREGRDINTCKAVVPLKAKEERGEEGREGGQ